MKYHIKARGGAEGFKYEIFALKALTSLKLCILARPILPRRWLGTGKRVTNDSTPRVQQILGKAELDSTIPVVNCGGKFRHVMGIFGMIFVNRRQGDWNLRNSHSPAAQHMCTRLNA